MESPSSAPKSAAPGLCFEARTSSLLSAVKLAASASPSGTPLPVLICVHLTLEGGWIRVVGSDLGVWVEAACQVYEGTDGVIALPADLLRDYLTELDSEHIKIEQPVAERRSVLIHCGRNHAQPMNGMDHTEFPLTPAASGASLTVQSADLAAAIKAACVAVSVEERYIKGNPILAGVLLEVNDGRAVLTSADGFRAAVVELGSQVEGTARCVVHKKALDLVGQMIERQVTPTAEVTITLDGTHVEFRAANDRVVARVLQGDYPNISRVIPKGWTTRVVCSTADMLQMGRSAGIFMHGNVDIVFDASGAGSFQVRGHSQDGEGGGEIEADFKGESVKVLVKGEYLIDALRAIKSEPTGERVALEMTAATMPVLITAEPKGHQQHVIMPMVLNKVAEAAA